MYIYFLANEASFYSDLPMYMVHTKDRIKQPNITYKETNVITWTRLFDKVTYRLRLPRGDILIWVYHLGRIVPVL